MKVNQQALGNNRVARSCRIRATKTAPRCVNSRGHGHRSVLPMTSEESNPDAMRAYQREWMQRRRAKYLAGKSCVDCGSTENLEIDHRDPAEKTSHRIWSWRHDRIVHELAKCDIRCNACHKARHAAERPEHGISAYKRKGCRCEVCRQAKREEGLRYKARKEGS